MIKTVLAPNAPWPKAEPNQKIIKKVGLKKIRIDGENAGLDFFLNTHEELTREKISNKHRTRDKLSGRFKSN